jgi:transposase
VSIRSVADFTHLKPNILNGYYKNHLSDFHSWNQKGHAEDFVLYRDNVGRHLAIDETSLSNGELYTVLTNKDGHGGRGTLVAMVKGVKSDYVIQKLQRLPACRRAMVESVTMDMSNSMYKIVHSCFPNAEQIVDRFHVQKLMYDALQDLRIRHRWEALNEENRMKAMYKEKGMRYVPETLPNGDTMRQLLVRCSRLLVRKPNDWTESQRARAEILFERLPDMKEFYFLALRLGKIYSDYDNKDVARTKLALWFNQVEAWHYDEFDIVIKTFMNHYERILNYFHDKRTNASAESFNCKLKTFRAEFRGVNDLKFYLYRVKQLYV